MRAMLMLSAIAVFCNACGGGSSGNSDTPDTDTQPIVGGDWYQPPVSATWQLQLQGDLDAVYDVDIYDIDPLEFESSQITQLQSNGSRVICYFSAGSHENWREDAGDFASEDLGNTLDGWPGERWLDIRSESVRAIMLSRLQLAAQKGCDGVDPDNMDGYTHDTGFDLDAQDQLEYNRFIANAAHRLKLSVGLKNDLDQIAELVDYFDFAINEQCFEYAECDSLLPFISHGKPVLHVEYQEDYVNNQVEIDSMCAQSVSLQFSTLVLPLALDSEFRISCI